MSRFKFKPEISKYGTLELEDRGVESLEEIIELFSNTELNQVHTLKLDNNKISSLDGIHKFKGLSVLSIKNNLISEIRDIDISWINSLEFADARFKNQPSKSFLLFFQGNPLSNHDFLKQIDFDKIFSTFHGFTSYGKTNDSIIQYPGSSVAEIRKGRTTIDTDYADYRNSICVWADDNNEIKKTHPYHAIISGICSDKIGVKNTIKAYSENNNCTEAEAYQILELLTPRSTWLQICLKEEQTNKSCFIATATMGSYDHPTVLELRRFRDELLMPKKWGRAFVSFYYQYGPIPARFIENSRSLKVLSYALIVKPLHSISQVLLKKLK